MSLSYNLGWEPSMRWLIRICYPHVCIASSSERNWKKPVSHNLKKTFAQWMTWLYRREKGADGATIACEKRNNIYACVLCSRERSHCKKMSVPVTPINEFKALS